MIHGVSLSVLEIWPLLKIENDSPPPPPFLHCNVSRLRTRLLLFFTFRFLTFHVYVSHTRCWSSSLFHHSRITLLHNVCPPHHHTFFFLFLYIVVKTGNGKGCRWNCTDTRLYRRVFVSISWRTIEQTISHTILAIFVSPFTNFVVFLLHLSRQTVIARRSWLTVSSFSREFLWNYWDWLVFFGVANISILLEQRERERERERKSVRRVLNLKKKDSKLPSFCSVTC